MTALTVLAVVACAGNNGKNGTNGTNGTDGVNGATGPTGPAGTDGVNGTNGINGINGVNGVNGVNGTNGIDGINGTNGVNGTDAPTSGAVSITVNQGNGTDGGVAGPLAGVTITATTTSGGSISDPPDAGLVITSTSDVNGSGSLTLPYGVYDLTFAKTGYASPAPVQVGIVAFQTVVISVTLQEATSSKPTLTVVASGTDIGYGNTATVTATGTSPLGETLTYKWANTTGFGLGSVTGTGSTGSITTPTLVAAAAREPDPTATGWNLGNFVSGYTIPTTFGVLPILDDTNGATTASVTVSDGFGQSATGSVTVTAASLQGTTHAAAIGTRVFLNAGTLMNVDGGTAPTWSLAGPSGSHSAFDNTSSMYPSFIPDLPGTYTATLGTSSLTIYAGTWVGAIGPGSTPAVNPWNGTTAIPFQASNACTGCHQGGLAVDEFTPWIGTKHAVHLTYGMDGVSGFSSGESCLGCHSVGFDLGNTNPAAGGLSEVAADAGWTYPTTIAATNWSKVPPAVQQLANIQCENCHGPQGGNGPGGFNVGHKLTDTDGGVEPFQSPRISYAAEDCGTCHAASTTHHHYSEWATLDSTRPGSNPLGKGHSNLLVAQSEGLTNGCGTGYADGGVCVGGAYNGVAAGPELNSSCGRCHTAQGYTEAVANYTSGNIGALSPVQLAAGQVNVNNIQPQTCQACHDPHQDAVDPVTGEDEYQLRLWNNTPMLPAGFAAYGVGAGAVCISCHNSRNAAYNASTIDNSTTQSYLHEDSDPIGSNPAQTALNTMCGSVVSGVWQANTGSQCASLGAKFSSLSTPHEANQSDVFEGHNAYFLGNQTPVVSPHSAVKDTCVGCHMTNNPQTYSSHGAATTATHMFAILDADTPALCQKCHANGTTSADGASLQASVNAGLNQILTNMGNAVVNRVNDAAGAYVAPAGYGTWKDTGTVNLTGSDSTPGCVANSASEPTCGWSTSAAIYVVAKAAPAWVANQVYAANSLITVGTNTWVAKTGVTAGATIPAGLSGTTSPVADSVGSWTLLGTTINPVVSASVVAGRSPSFLLTFASPISTSFTGKNAAGVSTTLTASVSTFTIGMTSLKDAAGNVFFAQNGNMSKANWNYELIAQDESYGVHNPPFVSAVLSATADPEPNPLANPPIMVGGLWF